MTKKQLKEWLDKKADIYNRPFFIERDPISIPHQYTTKQDIEIAGLFAAVFAWGNRTTIINKSNELMALMDHAPFQFCTQHQDIDLKRLLGFKHRTFNATDLLYFIAFLKQHYMQHTSLETAFTQGINKGDAHIEYALRSFYDIFFSLTDVPYRTRKHIATPAKRSTCKRLCMYLRWMVRKDKRGVDFGIWKSIKSSQLIMPLDVHVVRIARALNLLDRNQTDWETALELTERLREFDAQDPVKYDFALFGSGVMPTIS